MVSWHVNLIIVGECVTHVTMFLLHKSQKRGHVRSTKMVDRFQTGKHARLTQSLEMVFTNVL